MYPPLDALSESQFTKKPKIREPMPHTHSAKKHLKQSVVHLREEPGDEAVAFAPNTRKVIDAVEAGNAEKAEAELRVVAKKVDQSRRQACHPSQRRLPHQGSLVGQGEEAQGEVRVELVV